MRLLKTLIPMAALALTLSSAAGADESNKLTYLTFSKPVQLPGKMLPAGRYRFELADTQESRRVIKVQSEDGKKQLAMLLSIPNQLRDIPKDPVVMFSETAVGQPDAVKSYNYPGERIGYEFIYSRAEAMIIAHRTHAPVLAEDGNSIHRIDENGQKVDDKGRRLISRLPFQRSGQLSLRSECAGRPTSGGVSRGACGDRDTTVLRQGTSDGG